MSYECILTAVHGEGPRKTALITLNRPKALNALNDQLMDELGQALLAFDADDGIGCIVLTGSERAFAAGADIPTMAPHTFLSAFKSGLISKNSVALIKELVNLAYQAPLSDGVAGERRYFHALFGTHDQREGMEAFLAKRSPQFEHR